MFFGEKPFLLSTCLNPCLTFMGSVVVFSSHLLWSHLGHLDGRCGVVSPFFPTIFLNSILTFSEPLLFVLCYMLCHRFRRKNPKMASAVNGVYIRLPNHVWSHWPIRRTDRLLMNDAYSPTPRVYGSSTGSTNFVFRISFSNFISLLI